MSLLNTLCERFPLGKCFFTNGKFIWIELNKSMPFPLNRVIVTNIFVHNVRKSFWGITFLEQYTGIGSVKTYSLDDISDIHLAIDFGNCFLTDAGWFNFLFIYTGLLSGFLFDL